MDKSTTNKSGKNGPDINRKGKIKKKNLIIELLKIFIFNFVNTYYPIHHQ
jgi:hypothetical protein